MRLWQRRERCARHRIKGLTFKEIAKKEGISEGAAFSDVAAYFKHAAMTYNAPRFREELALRYRAHLEQVESFIDKMVGDNDESIKSLSEEKLTIVDRLLIRREKALSGLAMLYGFQGDRTFILQPGNGASAGAVLAGEAAEWAKQVDPKRMNDLRTKVREMMALTSGQAVDAKFETIAEKKEEEKEETAETSVALRSLAEDPPMRPPLTVEGG